MSAKKTLGILLPEDGPSDYEWYGLDRMPACRETELPLIEIGKISSDGHHDPAALIALGAVDRLAPVGEALVRQGKADAVIWACTSGSFVGGLEWATDQTNRLEQALGVPVTSTALAFLAALSALGHRRVDLLSPYPDEVTERLIGFLRDGGVTVEHIKALDCAYAADSHQLDIVNEVRGFCAERRASRNPLLIPDTAVNTLGLVEALNEDADQIILTANQVSLWAGLRLLHWPRQPACLASLVGV